MPIATANAEFLEDNQNWQDETTVYWFRLSGTDRNTAIDFEDEVFGIAESGADSQVLDEDGSPLTDGDHQAIAVRNTVQDVMNDDLRHQVSGL